MKNNFKGWSSRLLLFDFIFLLLSATQLISAPGKKIHNSPLFVRVAKLNESGLIGPVIIQKYIHDYVTY